MNFQLALVVYWSTALFYARDVPGSSPGHDIYFYNVGFIFFLSFFFQSFYSRYSRLVMYFSFFKLFTKNSIRKIWWPMSYLHLINKVL